MNASELINESADLANVYEAIKTNDYLAVLMHDVEVCTREINNPENDRDTRIAFLDARAVSMYLISQYKQFTK